MKGVGVAINEKTILAAGVVALAVYFVLSRDAVKAGGAVVDTAGGVLSGNNALTAGTPYEGGGVAGTVGAGVNSILGGVPQAIGESIGGWFYDLTHQRENPVILDAWGNLTGGGK
jgi:hypothetical protein